MTFEPSCYSISIRKELHDDEEFYVGRVAEFPNIGVFESSPEDAYALVVDAINTLNDIAGESGQVLPLPFPAPQDEFSGRVTLRLPRTLHAKVSAHANFENCSVNTFLISAISQFVGEKNMSSKFSSHTNVAPMWERKVFKLPSDAKLENSNTNYQKSASIKDNVIHMNKHSVGK